jgi:hypothetical protein
LTQTGSATVPRGPSDGPAQREFRHQPEEQVTLHHRPRSSFPLSAIRCQYLIPIATGYELVPAYIDADPAGQATPAAPADTFAAIALVTNAAGNFLGFGVVVPLYAVSILTTRALPRWIGWLGLLVGVLAVGWAYSARHPR